MPMDAKQLETYLHDRIPLSRAMAIEVREATAGRVTLFAPLAPNINHRDTVFGGSASAVAILAAWSVVRVRMLAEGLSGRIVIRRNTMSYELPMAACFTATAGSPDEDEWARLRVALARGRPARVAVNAVLDCMGSRAGLLEGEFVVLPDGGDAT
jgi:thioesterase domain-containing protein